MHPLKQDLKHGGYAILDALRKLGVDYIFSSPGSDWPPLWEALTRESIESRAGLRMISSLHESLAASMAIGYSVATGRLQALVLHTSVGVLHCAMALRAAYHEQVPLIVLAGESATFGQVQKQDFGAQWIRDLGIARSLDGLVASFTKWSNIVKSVHTLYPLMIRGGEIAVRSPQGPTFLSIPMEVMVESWEPPHRADGIKQPPPNQPNRELIDDVARIVAESQRPLILTESAGRSGKVFKLLVELAELIGAPVVETSTPYYANFPKSNTLHLGYNVNQYISNADVFLVMAARVPWYPISSQIPPESSKVIVMDENPIRIPMPYQALHADIYVEADLASSLDALIDALKNRTKLDADRISDRRIRWQEAHKANMNQLAQESTLAKTSNPIDPSWLCEVIGKILPENSVYVDETTVHRPMILKHIPWDSPQSYFHAPGGGLGIGLGMALGIKLAFPERFVACLIGDGAFLYNPAAQFLCDTRHYNLPILVVVFNNNSYEAMRRAHKQFYPEGVGVKSNKFIGAEIHNPEFSELAKSSECFGEKVMAPDMLESALERAVSEVQNGRTAVVDAILKSMY